MISGDSPLTVSAVAARAGLPHADRPADARDLPEDLKVANKSGLLEGVRNDSGIVFLENRPYIVCVMTTYLRRERHGEEAISKISLDAYRMFDRLARASEYGRIISPSNSGK